MTAKSAAFGERPSAPTLPFQVLRQACDTGVEFLAPVKYIQPHMRTLRAGTRANGYVQEALEECSNDGNSLREVVDFMPGTRGRVLRLFWLRGLR
jgi:hypothetical protein